MSSIKNIDWQKTIGAIVRSKDNLDMGIVIQYDNKDYQTSHSLTIEYGDRERLTVPKETIYRIDKEFDKTYLHTTLTENEILTRRDPLVTYMRSYVRDL
ncbi:MAG TPA: hypothetical protein VH796_09030 [Nitrososphaeraceae archaeon]|jgi:hypothetical protein